MNIRYVMHHVSNQLFSANKGLCDPLSSSARSSDIPLIGCLDFAFVSIIAKKMQQNSLGCFSGSEFKANLRTKQIIINNLKLL